MSVYTYSFPEIHSEGVKDFTCLLSEGFELHSTGHKMIALGRFGDVKARSGYGEQYLVPYRYW